MRDEAWKSVFDKYQIHQHNFNETPYYITAKQIKEATHHFTTTSDREVRILCKQDTREKRPQVFVENELFILPIKNGKFAKYAIIKGEGYYDVPEITKTVQIYKSKLTFNLDTSLVGNSEMQHLDYAYAASLIRTFLDDDTLVLTIRGRKYTPKSSFDVRVGNQTLTIQSVQTEVDAGYEGKHQFVLIEAKNSNTKNTIIKQLYYPYRQYACYTNKKIRLLFFEKRKNEYSLWQLDFEDVYDYNSIVLKKSERYEII